MNETAAGMTQTMPLYLIGVGLVLIFALAFLLLRMRKSSEEESLPAERSESETISLQRSAAKAPQAEESKGEESLPELPVEEDAFAETPDINRESFERFAGKHVLVVEDNPVNRKLILTLMAGSGIELDSAEDGVEALEKLRTPGARYDLVLMDVNMPRMDGLECTRQIRKDEKLRSIPVLALTASTTKEEVEAILGSGMNGYLDKPLNLGKLYTAFVRFIQEYRVPDTPSSAEESVQTDRNILDTKVGLEHTNNDRGLYRMLLEDFLQQYGSSDKEFKKLSAAKEYTKLHAMLIDLEGLSGTLGAMELYRIVTELNRILDRGTTMLLSDYETEYASAIQSLGREIESYLAV